MNWGVKIIVVYVCFIGMIFFLIIQSYTHPSDLVAKNYYAQELAYQEVIDKEINGKKIDSLIHVVLGSDAIIIKFNPKLKPIYHGNVTFYRPSHATWDRSFVLQLDQANTQHIDKSYFYPGYYTIILSWEDGVKKYQVKRDLTILSIP